MQVGGAHSSSLRKQLTVPAQPSLHWLHTQPAWAAAKVSAVHVAVQAPLGTALARTLAAAAAGALVAVAALAAADGGGAAVAAVDAVARPEAGRHPCSSAV